MNPWSYPSLINTLQKEACPVERKTGERDSTELSNKQRVKNMNADHIPRLSRELLGRTRHPGWNYWRDSAAALIGQLKQTIWEVDLPP